MDSGNAGVMHAGLAEAHMSQVFANKLLHELENLDSPTLLHRLWQPISSLSVWFPTEPLDQLFPIPALPFGEQVVGYK